jgi:hypothetical protein
MSDDLGDDGFDSSTLWGLAWFLAIGALVCVVRLATYAADGVGVQSEHFVWLIVGVLAGVFSAACAVLAGLKAAERRLAARGTPDVP